MTIFKDRMDNELTISQALPKITKRLCNYWLDFELMILRWVGHIPSHLVRKVVYNLCGVKIGKKSTIHIGAKFFQPKNIQIGEDTIVGSDVFLDGRASLKVGNHVDIASEVMIYNSQHDLESNSFEAIVKPVEVGDYVFIGPRVIILPGVKIGKGAVAAAGAVISKDVPEFSIVAGVPATVIGQRKIRELNYKLGRARLFQ